MKRKNCQLLLAAIVATTLSGCGGSGGSDGSVGSVGTPTAGAPQPVDNTGVQISGQVTKGPLDTADLEFIPIDAFGVAAGATVATATTAADGSFVANIPVGSGALLVRSSGGSFIDESDREPDPASKRRVALGAGEGLEGLLLAGETTVSLTIVGQSLLDKTRRESTGDMFLQQFAANRALATSAFGFDVVSTPSANPVSPNPAAPVEQRQYAMILGGLANVINRVSINAGFVAPNIETILAVAEDFSDGRIDGLVGTDPVMVGGVPIEAFSLNDEITRFRNNNFDSYASTPLMTVDESVFAQVGVPVNTIPVAVADAYALDPGGEIDVDAPGVLLNDTDDDGDTLSAVLVTGPLNAVAFDLAADGSFNYIHNGNSSNPDTFTYRASDGVNDSNLAIVTLEFNNSAPVANDDAGTVLEGGVLNGGSVLANDTDLNGDSLTAAVLDLPANGQLALNSDGTFQYTHSGSETTGDAFTYIANDGLQDSNPATVVLTVTPVNDAPTGNADSMTVDEGGIVTILDSGAASVLNNDSDAEMTLLMAVIETMPANGSLLLAANGTFSYTHNGSETTADAFTYRASDGLAMSGPVVVSVTINPINDAPITDDDFLIVEQGQTQTILASGAASVLANDVDPESDPLTAILVDSPFNGQLTLNADGTFFYEHDGSPTSDDEFSYVASDGVDQSAVQSVFIQIDLMNSIPIADDDVMIVSEGGTQTQLESGSDSVLDNDFDDDFDQLEAILVDAPSFGQLDLLDDGQFVYTHDGSETIFDSFIYVASDGIDDSNFAQVDIIIEPVNDSPVGMPDSITVTQAGTATMLDSGELSVLANDFDAEFDTLAALPGTDPLNGELQLNRDGTFSYTHDGSQTTTDSFTYFPSDSSVEFTTTVASSTGVNSGVFTPGEPVIVRYELDASVADTNQADNAGVYPDATERIALTFPDSGISLIFSGGNVQVFDNTASQNDQIFVFGSANQGSTQLANEDVIGVELDYIGTTEMVSDDTIPRILPGNLMQAFALLETASGTTIVNLDVIGITRRPVRAGSAAVQVDIVITPNAAVTFAQQAFIKASNPDFGDVMGYRAAMSADGLTLAVSSINEASAAIGVNGDESDNTADAAGAVYVFTATANGIWTQQAYLKASNTDASDLFGYRMSMSADGDTLVVAARGEASAATGINGDQADNSAVFAGAAYVFVRDGSDWFQQAYIKGSNTEIFDAFARDVALSGDGNTLAVGASGEASNATGIGGDQNDNSANASGATYVFTRSGVVWSQQAYIKSSNSESGDQFGMSVVLSADGNTLGVTANTESSAATGINGDQNDNSAPGSGALYTFTRDVNGAWSQQAYLKASNTQADDQLGSFGVLEMSADGNTMAVGVVQEDSAASGINGDGNDNSATDSGAVYVYGRDGLGIWSQQAYVKASNTDAGDAFGNRLALSPAGTTLLVGAYLEDGDTLGTGGDQSNNDGTDSGAAYLYLRDGTGNWSQQSYIKSDNTNIGDSFSFSIAMSENSMAIGSPGDSSSSAGINGDQSSNNGFATGAVFIYPLNSQPAIGNDPPLALTLDNQTILDGQAPGTLIGTLSTVDPDGSDTHLYTLADGVGSDNNFLVQIVGNQLQSADVFDTAQPPLRIRVRSDDQNGGTIERTFQISVVAVNNAPTDILLDNLTVVEGDQANSFANITTIDADQNDAHAYTLVAGPGDDNNDLFFIAGYDQLGVQGPLDAMQTPMLNVRLSADDTRGGVIEKSFVITVTSTNSAPTALELDPQDVAEGQNVGTVVGVFTTTDPDASDSHTYQLVAGAGDTDNSFFLIVNDELQTAAVFDSAQTPVLSIRVETSDGNGGTFEETFIITVNNVAAQRTWIATTDGAWGDPSNWSPTGAPQPGEAVIIDVATSNPVITIIDVFPDVFSLDCNEALVIEDGSSLTLHGPSTLSRNTTVRGELFADGPDASLIISGVANLAQGALTAIGGAFISVEDLPFFDSSAQQDWVAEGTGSQIVFVDLTSIVVGNQTDTGAQLSIEAINGGLMNFPGLTDILVDDGTSPAQNEGWVDVVADGVNSRVQMPQLQTYVDADGDAGEDGLSHIDAINAGVIEFPMLTNPRQVKLIMDSDANVTIAQLVSMPDSVIELDGGVFSFPNLMALSGSIVRLGQVIAPTVSMPSVSLFQNAGIELYNGSSLSLPGVSDYVYNRDIFDPLDPQLGSEQVSWIVDGAGSSLVMPNLTSGVMSGLQTGPVWFIEATGGGVIDLPALTELRANDDGGSLESGIFLEAGANSQVLMPALTTFNDFDSSGTPFTYLSAVFAHDGGVVEFPLLTSPLRLAIAVQDDLSSITLTQLTSMNSGVLDLSSQFYDLSNLTDFPASTIFMRDGATADMSAVTEFDNAGAQIFGSSVLVLPGITSYNFTSNPGFGDMQILIADGVASRLEFPNLTSLVVSGASNELHLTIEAVDAGFVDFPMLDTMTVDDNGSAAPSDITVRAGGVDSLVDFQVLSSFIDNDLDSASAIIELASGQVGIPGALTTFNVSINGNQNPTDIILDNDTVFENQPVGTSVGFFATVDGDTGDSHIYSLVAGAGDTDNAAFQIVDDELQTAVIFDGQQNSTLIIRVRTDDQNGGVFEESFIISVFPPPNSDPTSLDLSNSTVFESQPIGTTIGFLSTEDVDQFDSHIYTLVAGAGDSDNALVQIVGDELQTATVLDSQANATLEIRLQTDDQNGGTLQSQFIISVNQVRTITWVSQVSGDWNDPGNWSPAGPPIPGDAVVIDTPGIEVDMSSVNTDVVSIQSTQPINMSSVLLTVHADSNINGFGLVNSVFTVDRGATLTLSNVSGFEASSLYVDGATLSVQDTNLSPSFFGDNLFWAMDENSVIEFPNLTNIVIGLPGSTERSIITVLVDGGVADFPSLTSVVVEDNGNFRISGMTFRATLANSQINLSQLSTFDDNDPAVSVTSGGSALEAYGGSLIAVPLLTELDQVDLAIDGVSSINIAQLTAMTNGSLDLDGRFFSFPNLTNMRGSIINVGLFSNAIVSMPAVNQIGSASFNLANSSVLNLPGVTSYAMSDNNFLDEANWTVSFDASLTLPNLTSILVTGDTTGPIWTSEVFSGGVIDLPALQSVTVVDDGSFRESYARFEALDPGSLISLPQLTSFSDTDVDAQQGGLSALFPRAGGTIDLPLLEQTDGVRIQMDGTGGLDIEQLTHITNGMLQIDDGTFVFPNLSDLSGSIVTIGTSALASVDLSSVTAFDGGSADVSNGSTLSFPGVTSYQLVTNNFMSSVLWAATGTGTVLEFPNLFTGEIAGLNLTEKWLIEAFDGGLIDLPALTSLLVQDGGGFRASDIDIFASGVGSRVQMPVLTVFNDADPDLESGLSALVADTGGVIDIPLLTATDQVGFSLDNQSTISVSQLTDITNAVLELDAGTHSFPGLTNISGTIVRLGSDSNASADLSNVTDADHSSFEVYNGSVLTMSSVTSVFLDTNVFNNSGMWLAQDQGSRLEFPALNNIQLGAPGTTGIRRWLFQAESMGVIDLPDLMSINVTNGSNFSIRDLDMFAGSFSEIRMPQLTSFIDADPDGNEEGTSLMSVTDNGSINVPQLTSMSGVSVTMDELSGVSIDALVTMQDGVLTLSGGTYSFPNMTAMPGTHIVILGEANVDLSNVSNFDGGGAEIYDGSSFSLPGVTSYLLESNFTMNTEAIFRATSTNSLLEFPNLVTITVGINASTGNRTLDVEAFDLGQVSFPVLTDLIVEDSGNVSRREIHLLADGAPALVDMPSLNNFIDNDLDTPSTVTTAGGGGVVNIPGTAVLMNVDVVGP